MPFKELEKSAEDATVALQARLIGLLVRKGTQALLDERKKGHLVTLLLINQWRNKIAMMGDPRSLPGGNALKFFTSLRFEVMNKEVLGVDARNTEVVDHNLHSFKITKNKIGNGIRSGEFTMIRNPDHPLEPGYIDEEETILAYARKFDIFTGGGSSWRLDEVDLRFHKIQEAKNYLLEHPDFTETLRVRLICEQRAACGLQATGWDT
jgi:recombination protein RecA